MRSITATDTITPRLTATRIILSSIRRRLPILLVLTATQTTTINTAFAIPLQVQVTTPLVIQFLIPTSALLRLPASANFSNSDIVTTIPEGIATAPTLTANVYCWNLSDYYK